MSKQLISHKYLILPAKSKEDADKVIESLSPFVEALGGRIQAKQVDLPGDVQGLNVGDWGVMIDAVIATKEGIELLSKENHG